MKTKLRTRRVNDNEIAISYNGDFDITLFANKDVEIDRQSIAETINLFEINETVKKLNQINFFGDIPGELSRCLLTPDFHKGAGIPVGTVMQTKGFVLPRSAGTDIGCGMRLVIASITKDEFLSMSGAIDEALRHAFFEGGRDIPMTEAGRAAMLREGILGLHEVKDTGIWKQIDSKRIASEISRMHRNGSWKTNDLWNFEDYVKGSGGTSRDSLIASIGGGNHFVELQYVDECIDKQTCYDWGIKKGHISIMAHTGSVDFGSSIGGFFMDMAKTIYPRIEHPEHGFYPLPTTGDLDVQGKKYLSAMGLAANFAIVNRLMLTELTLRCLSQVLGREVSGHLVYDAPHNLVWSDDDCCSHIHRKGATPAEFFECDEVFPNGHPVIIPGSMGDASYVLRGNGSVGSLCSAPHGAGRITARGEGRRGDIKELDTIRVVTKMDPRKTRRDVADELIKNLMEEAPSNYKAIGPAIETVKDAGIAEPVAKLMPLLTIKG